MNMNTNSRLVLKKRVVHPVVVWRSRHPHLRSRVSVLFSVILTPACQVMFIVRWKSIVKYLFHLYYNCTYLFVCPAIQIPVFGISLMGLSLIRKISICSFPYPSLHISVLSPSHLPSQFDFPPILIEPSTSTIPLYILLIILLVPIFISKVLHLTTFYLYKINFSLIRNTKSFIYTSINFPTYSVLISDDFANLIPLLGS